MSTCSICNKSDITYCFDNDLLQGDLLNDSNEIKSQLEKNLTLNEETHIYYSSIITNDSCFTRCKNINGKIFECFITNDKIYTDFNFDPIKHNSYKLLLDAKSFDELKTLVNKIIIFQ